MRCDCLHSASHRLVFARFVTVAVRVIFCIPVSVGVVSRLPLQSVACGFGLAGTQGADLGSAGRSVMHRHQVEACERL